MDRAVRIAVVAPVDDRLAGDLRALPLQPEVRSLQSLHGETDALTRFEPDVLVTGLGEAPAEQIGALRLLKNLWPQTAVVIATDVAGEIEASGLATRIGATLIVYPGKPGQLAATIEQALHGGGRPRAEVFHDLAHGMADEINNPLLFVSGHLQLLHGSLDPTTEHGRRDQVRAALDGVQRIQQTVDRLRLLSEASVGPRRCDPVDLAVLVQDAIAGRGADTSPATVTIQEGTHLVSGDPGQLTPATAALVRFADALAGAGCQVSLALSSLDTTVRLRLTIGGDGLLQWRLPPTFEPFYPSHLLRGHGHGLSLFMAQTVVLGHKGQAAARKLGDGSLQIDFVLRA